MDGEATFDTVEDLDELPSQPDDFDGGLALEQEEVGQDWHTQDGISYLTTPDGVTLVQLDADPFVDGILLQDQGGTLEIWDLDDDRAADRVLIDVDGDGNPEYGLQLAQDGRWALIGIDPATGQYGEPVFFTADELPAELRELTNVVMPPVDQTDTTSPESVIPADEDPSRSSPDDTPQARSNNPAPWVNTGPAATGGTDYTAPTMYGDPLEEAAFWRWQGDQNYCVPASVFQIVAEYAPGQFEDVTDVVTYAADHDLIDLGPDGSTSGMSLADAERLLEITTGVDVDLVTDTNLQDLAGYLRSGHDVMVFVDGYEYWAGQETPGIYHAAVITGIDFEQGVVILSDPGVTSGALLEIPIDVFENSWADMDHTVLVMPEPAPETPSDSASMSDARSPVADEELDRPPAVDVTRSPEQVWLDPVAATIDGTEGGTSVPGVDAFVERAFGEPPTGDVADEAIKTIVRRPWVLAPVFLGVAALTRRRL